MPRNGVAYLAHVALLNDCVRKRSCWAAAGGGDPEPRDRRRSSDEAVGTAAMTGRDDLANTEAMLPAS
jgi:hypothetical protein